MFRAAEAVISSEPLNPSLWLWGLTLAGFVIVICIDLFVVDSHPHNFTTREAGRWVTFYIALAIAFGIFIWLEFGKAFGQQFFAGWITEYSLSVDNLFVFLVIMSSFAVPQAHQHRVLLIGIVIALILRAILIAVGAAAIHRFAEVFYLFGAFLLYTAYSVWTSHDKEPNPDGNGLVRLAERVLPTTREYHEAKLTVKVNGKRLVTPMLLVMLAVGTTDLLFALDSIPAVYGLTREPFIVFSANAFALMGLRQLYFLLGGLVSKLIYLPQGLAVILGFIGVKLILEAVHETTEINAPTVTISVSLSVIVLVLAATTVLSLRAVKKNPELAKHSVVAEAKEEALEHEGEGLGHIPAGEEA